MTWLFENIIEAGIGGTAAIAAVLALRLLLRKADRNVCLLLWGGAFLKLVSFAPIRLYIGEMPFTETGNLPILASAGAAVREVSQALPEAGHAALRQSSGGTALWIAEILWLIGMAGMLASQLYWTARLKKLKAKARRESADILICSQIRNAFAVGIFRPQIYLPAGCSAETRACILAHERAHIARHDNLWRLLAYLVLTLHWFNPAVWLAYALFCTDIELACDDRAVASMDRNRRRQYAETVLNFAGRSSGLSRKECCCAAVSPFGKPKIRTRITRILDDSRCSKRTKRLLYLFCAVFLMLCVTEFWGPDNNAEQYPDSGDIGKSVVAEAENWLHETFQTKYELRKVHAQILDTFDHGEEVRYTILLRWEERKKAGGRRAFQESAAEIVLGADKQDDTAPLKRYFRAADGFLYDLETVSFG